MSRKKVIVKRLNWIQNLGHDGRALHRQDRHAYLGSGDSERHCDVVRNEDDGVLELALSQQPFPDGLRNVLDRAILQFKEIREKLSVSDHKKIDEIPFDFSRKRMSVVVETPQGVRRLICKGATEAVFKCCNRFELEGKVYPVDPLLITELKETCDELSAMSWPLSRLPGAGSPHPPPVPVGLRPGCELLSLRPGSARVM